MTLDEFRKSLVESAPPAGLTHALAGLWWDAKGDWKRAHEFAQQDERTDGSWVHAYLHRKEGDHGNAAYWYNRAGKPVCREPLDAEWLSIVTITGDSVTSRNKAISCCVFYWASRRRAQLVVRNSGNDNMRI